MLRRRSVFSFAPADIPAILGKGQESIDNSHIKSTMGDVIKRSSRAWGPRDADKGEKERDGTR